MHEDRLKVLRSAGLVVSAIAAAVVGALLVAGVVSGGASVLLVLVECALVAVVAVLLPARIRNRLAPFLAAFVAAAGLIPVFVPDDDGSSSSPVEAEDLNPIAFAALVRQGPFSEELPNGLRAIRLADVNIAEASAAGRVDALELEIQHPRSVDVYAHLEVYESPEAATERARERIELIERILGPGTVDGDPASYCAVGTIRAPTSWECGGTSDLVYAEATVTPNANAYQPLATGTVSAILGYAEEKARVAGS